MAKKVKLTKVERMHLKALRDQDKAAKKMQRAEHDESKLEITAVRKFLKAMSVDAKRVTSTGDNTSPNVTSLLTKKIRNKPWVSALSRGLENRREEVLAAMSMASDTLAVLAIADARKADKAADRANRRAVRTAPALVGVANTAKVDA